MLIIDMTFRYYVVIIECIMIVLHVRASNVISSY